jgi:hypothetical protein
LSSKYFVAIGLEAIGLLKANTPGYVTTILGTPKKYFGTLFFRGIQMNSLSLKEMLKIKVKC